MPCSPSWKSRGPPGQEAGWAGELDASLLEPRACGVGGAGRTTPPPARPCSHSLLPASRSPQPGHAVPPLYEANYGSETSTMPRCMDPIRLRLKTNLNTIRSFPLQSRSPSARGRGWVSEALLEPVTALAWEHSITPGCLPTPPSPRGSANPCLLCWEHPKPATVEMAGCCWAGRKRCGHWRGDAVAVSPCPGGYDGAELRCCPASGCPCPPSLGEGSWCWALG